MNLLNYKIGVQMHRLIIGLFYISSSLLFYSCNINTPHDIAPSREIYSDIYFNDLNKNIFIKIGEGSYPKFIPNSDKVLFLQGLNVSNPGNRSLFIVNKDGTGKKALIESTSIQKFSSSTPPISPFGDKIIVTINSDVYLMNTDGSSLTNLTEGKILIYTDNEVFSKDGKTIIFNSDKGIGMMEINNKKLTILKAKVDSVSFSNVKFASDDNYVIYVESNTKTKIDRIRIISLNNSSMDKVLYSLNYFYANGYCVLPNNKILTVENVKNNLSGSAYLIDSKFVVIDIITGEVKTYLSYASYIVVDWGYISTSKNVMVKFSLEFGTGNYLFDAIAMEPIPYVQQYPLPPVSGLAVASYSSENNQLLFVSSEHYR